MYPILAVVIPCYNYGLYLEQAVDSVLNSTFQDLEIIIVNDGSTDPYTLEVLENMCLKPKTKVIHRENGGLSAARNTGFNNTMSKYILTLDADDLIHPTFIEKGVWLLEKDLSTSFVYSVVQLFGERNYIWTTLPYNFNYLKFRNVIPASIIIRRSHWEKISGYDETMREGYEDWEYILRLGKNGMTGHHINEILFYYRQHNGSMLSGSKLKHKKLLKEIRRRNKEIFNYRYLQFTRFLFIEFLRQVALKVALVRGEIINKVRHNSSLWGMLKTIWFRLSPQKIMDVIEPEIITKYPIVTARDSKNILIVLPWLKYGGVEKVFLQILSSLSETYNFILVTTKAGSDNPWEGHFRPFVKALYHIGDFGKDDKERMLFLDYLIKTHNISIMHLSNSQFAYRGVCFLRQQNPGLKIIDTLHMEEPWSPWDFFTYSLHYSKCIDLTTTLTNSQRLRLHSQVTSNKFEVIPNGIKIIPNSLSCDLVAKNYITIGLIGRVSVQKRPIYFLELARECKRQNLPFRFLIVGGGELENKVIQLIRKWDLKESVRIEGFTDDIYEKFKEIDVLCAPSLREGLPMIGLEAMNFGIPIVASRVPGWTDLIEDNITGFLCEQHSDFIDKFKILLDKNVYNKITTNAKREIQKGYSLDKMINKYENLYEKVVKNGK